MDQLYKLFNFENALMQNHFELAFAFVFVASLIGSLHCVSMCGGLSLSASQSKTTIFNYHIGRLIGYTTIGGLVGVFGQQIFKTLSGLNVYAFLLMLAVFALVIYFLTTHLNLKSQVMKVFKAIRLKNLSPAKSSLLLGLFTPLIPCAWLYAFIVLAFSSASFLSAAGLLVAFWLGTVPILFIFQMGLHKYLPKLTPVPRIILIGAIVVFSAFNVKQHFSHAHHHSTHSHQNKEAETPNSHQHHKNHSHEHNH